MSIQSILITQIFLIEFLLIILYIFAKTKVFSDKKCTKHISLKVYYGIILFFISLIPFANVIIITVLVLDFIEENNIFYKSGWFIKFLNKKI